MFRLIYRDILSLVFRVVYMYYCWCFESTSNSTYKPLCLVMGLQFVLFEVFRVFCMLFVWISHWGGLRTTSYKDLVVILKTCKFVKA